jgi:hypothetical protein
MSFSTSLGITEVGSLPTRFRYSFRNSGSGLSPFPKELDHWRPTGAATRLGHNSSLQGKYWGQVLQSDKTPYKRTPWPALSDQNFLEQFII